MGNELKAESIRQMSLALRTLESALELILLDYESNSEEAMVISDKEGQIHGSEKKKQNNNPL